MGGLLVHEWISASGGSEKVLNAFADIYPEADIKCLWNDVDRFGNREVHETWLARTPLRKSKALALPFMPMTWAITPRQDYDWVLTSSHLFAHHARVMNGTRAAKKFSYIHTPARYLWSADLDERGANPAIRSIAPFFRAVDRAASRSTFEFAANSEFIRKRIQRTWDRDAKVIYPPVDVTKIQAVTDWSNNVKNGEESRILDHLPETFILGASRFVPYKRLDLVIEAGVASDLPVVIAGAGPGLEFLRDCARQSGIPVTFVEGPSDEMLFALYQRAMVFVFPAIEDFGIMPVEAMACGTPVVVNALGGASESANVPLAGISIEAFTGTELSNAIYRASTINRDVVSANSRNFSLEKFKTKIADWIDQGNAL